MLGAMTRLLRRIRLPLWVIWMMLSTVLFLGGSANFALRGAHEMAQVGLVGAIAAIAVMAAFLR